MVNGPFEMAQRPDGVKTEFGNDMDELSAIVSDLPNNLRAAKVGFFWVVNDRMGQDAILAEMVDLSQGEVYGPSVVHPGGHYKFWTKMKRLGSSWLRAKGLSSSLVATEYEEWPRGRVSFSLETRRFMLFADPRLRTASRIAMIQDAFGLPEGSFEIRSDGHYQPIRVGQLKSW